MPPFSLQQFHERTSAILDLLRRLVEMESPTTDKAHVDALGQFAAQRAAEAGATLRPFAQPTAGDHWLAEWGEGPDGLLLLAHLDTVHPLGTLERMPWSVEDGRATGPGSIDMKGGIAVALAALGALSGAGMLPRHPIRILFTSDEETGSRTSRALIEELARQHRAVFCLEPAMPDGALKTWRKGTGLFILEVTGVPSHAGNSPESGVNAIVEMAHQILRVQALARPEAGTTISTGTIEGGTRTNVVPARCRAKVDIRVLEIPEQARLSQAFQDLQPVLPGAKIAVSGGWNRPPMARTPTMAAAFGRARTIAKGLGLDLQESGTGGGSDANFVAALGVPVLDGLGPLGNGAHSDHEFVMVSSLPERAALLAALLTEW
jgi:glutamate carboxypeptidase